MSQKNSDNLEGLVALSRNGSKRSRQVLFENIADIFTSPKNRLNERERALITDILSKLISSTEVAIKKHLSERIANIDSAPAELIALLANDKFEVARPVLFDSHVLAEPDLIQIVRHRSKEHLMVVAQRDDISAAVSDMLIQFGDEDVITGLIENGDADISRESMDFLVEESRRVDRFQEPLLDRSDLPTELAHKMFWWVSAALRRHILQKFDVSEIQLDETLADTNIQMQAEHASTGATHAEKLVQRVDKNGDLTERFLVQSLRSKQIRIFSAGLSLKSKLDAYMINRFIFDTNAEALGVVCKAVNFDRNSFSAVFLLTRNAHLNHDGKDPLAPETMETILKFYDSLTVEKAKLTLRHWRIDGNYWQAINDLQEDRSQDKVFL